MILGRYTSGAASDRVFVYEVAGLRQSDMTAQDNATIRQSSTVLMPIPFSRMNEFMQRINRLGGKIVAIHDRVDAAAAPEAAPQKSKGKKGKGDGE
jgi:phycocyanin-associated, rod